MLAARKKDGSLIIIWAVSNAKLAQKAQRFRYITSIQVMKKLVTQAHIFQKPAVEHLAVGIRA